MPDALHARAMAVRRRSPEQPGDSGWSGSRSSRGGSVASIASASTSGRSTQSARRVFAVFRVEQEREQTALADARAYGERRRQERGIVAADAYSGDNCPDCRKDWLDCTC